MTFIDVVFPSENETAFCKRACQLGTTYVCFVYEFGTDLKKARKRLDSLDVITAVLGLKVPYTITPQQAAKLRQQGILLFHQADPQHLRHVIDRRRADIIYHLEATGRKEYTHHRNSGMNQVIAKILKDKDLLWGISFEAMLTSMRNDRAHVFGRIMQNMKLQKKYGFSSTLASFATHPDHMRARGDLQSILIALGADQKRAKEAINALGKKKK
ncbi:MAG: RNase P subunit p30 family protein [Nanoarchaeota archaeon]